MRRHLALMALVGLVVATTSFGAAGAATAGCSSFSAVAAADGARGEVFSPGYLVVERADAGVPAAQAAIDSGITSSAYAGYPWPGDVALSGLALTPLAGRYPLAARSNYPTAPDAKVDGGAVTLSAQSAPLASDATARAGAGQGDAAALGLTTASAEANCSDDGTVAAVADNDVQGLSFGDGILRIGRIHSTAKASTAGGAQTDLQRHLEVDAVTIAGQAVGFDDGGLPDNPLAQALRDHGVTVSYLAPSVDADGRGVVAPGLRISVEHQLVGSGPTVLTYTFGRAYAASRQAGDVGGADTASFAAVVDAGDPGTPAAAMPANVGVDTAAAVPTTGTSEARHEVSLGAPRLSRTRVGHLPARFYAVLVVGAATVFLGAVLSSTRKVRRRWT